MTTIERMKMQRHPAKKRNDADASLAKLVAKANEWRKHHPEPEEPDDDVVEPPMPDPPPNLSPESRDIWFLECRVPGGRDKARAESVQHGDRVLYSNGSSRPINTLGFVIDADELDDVERVRAVLKYLHLRHERLSEKFRIQKGHLRRHAELMENASDAVPVGDIPEAEIEAVKSLRDSVRECQRKILVAKVALQSAMALQGEAEWEERKRTVRTATRKAGAQARETLREIKI